MIIPYAKAFEIAKCARRASPELFRDGVERAAALAAVDAKTKDEVVSLMEVEFLRHRVRCQKWDGSIA